MSENQVLQSLVKEVKLLRRQLSTSPKKEKQTWIKPSLLAEITGWKGREKLRWARTNSLVQYERGKGYLLESINPVFIIKPLNATTHAAQPQAN